MPRQISIAKFYDWTDDLYDCVSVSKSKLYDNMNELPRRFTEKDKSQNIRWCSNGVRVTPGRMFSRERGNLTKGEVKIINGIYRNRGNLTQDDSVENLRSHKDAWRLRKYTENLSGDQTESVDLVSSHGMGGNEDTAPRQQSKARHAHNSLEPNTSANQGSTTTLNLCFANEGQRVSNRILEKTVKHIDEVESGQYNCPDERGNAEPKIVLEDCTSDDDALVCECEGKNTSSASKMNLVEGCHSVTYSRGQSIKQTDSEGSVTRRVQMEVFLPVIPCEPTEDDIKTSLLQGRPLLERERPMSHTRYKHKPDQQTGI